jgi:hypothetical protein
MIPLLNARVDVTIPMDTTVALFIPSYCHSKQSTAPVITEFLINLPYVYTKPSPYAQ